MLILDSVLDLLRQYNKNHNRNCTVKFFSDSSGELRDEGVELVLAFKNQYHLVTFLTDNLSA